MRWRCAARPCHWRRPTPPHRLPGHTGVPQARPPTGCRTVSSSNPVPRRRRCGRAAPWNRRNSSWPYGSAWWTVYARRASCGRPRERLWCESSFPLPAHSALGVLQDDSLGEQLVANLIGERKITGLLGGRALGDARVDFRVAELSLLRAGLEHVEDRIEE